jgi:hypothetical protein
MHRAYALAVSEISLTKHGVKMKSHIETWLLCVIASVFLFGCASDRPYRTRLVDVGDVECPLHSAGTLERCSNVTPETGQGYELHFVEFDDQGWMPTLDNESPTAGNTSQNQIDHLMNRLDKLLDENSSYLNIIVYVHGWKHDARSDDSDVERFRQVLASARTLERGGKDNPRKVVGIYVGWRGKSWNLPGPLINLSFWSRKAAALRVSHGTVQELFARLRTVQQYYNSRTASPDCATPREGRLTTGGCRVRTLMIGHSFGAWILYSAMSGQIMATLNAERDLDAQLDQHGKDDTTGREHAAKGVANRRPAEMIVLINPAFEAVRYQPVHQAAINYKNRVAQPPILVTITSTADLATKDAFPAGRFLNSIFERPVTSEEQNEAMTHTHGHIELYQTHELIRIASEPCPGWQKPGPLSSSDKDQILKNKAIEVENSARFFNQYTQDNGLLRPWVRDFCGGVRLVQLKQSDPRQNRDPNSLVWNIRTDASLIPGHSEIMGDEFLEFVRQLYDDTELQH